MVDQVLVPESQSDRGERWVGSTPASSWELRCLPLEAKLQKLFILWAFVIVSCRVSGVSTSVKQWTHVHHIAIVIAVRGNAIAASNQTRGDTTILPLPSMCTNWVEKKFCKLVLSISPLERVRWTYRHNGSWEIDEGDNSQDLDRRSIFGALFLQRFSTGFRISFSDAVSDLQLINT